MRLPSFLPFVTGALLIPRAYAWGAVGHEIMATIAEMHVHPSVMPKLCEVLDHPGECHLAPVAAWADKARRWGKYRWTGPLHYINAVDDYPSQTCAFPGPNGWRGRTHINVLNGIRNTTTVLQEFVASRRADGPWDRDRDDIPIYVEDALKFLIHFIGDMHMPLHLAGRHRGGNGDKVAFDGRTTNLHKVWDSLLISERIRTLPENYTQPLPLPEVESYFQDTIYDPYIRRIVWEGLRGKWKDEINDWLVCPRTPCADDDAMADLSATPASTWQTVLSFFSSGVISSRWDDEDRECEDASGLYVDDDKLCPYAWAKPIHQLDCDFIFPAALDEGGDDDDDDDDDEDEDDFALLDRHAARANDEPSVWGGVGPTARDLDDALAALRRESPYLELNTPEYAGMIKERWIIEKLLTQAGVRLAAVLNWIFADGNGRDWEENYVTL